MSEHRTCRHPDRDEPRMMCGYPLPCPWHTAVINLEEQTVTIPFASDVMKSPMRERVGQIGRALVPPGPHPPDPVAPRSTSMKRAFENSYGSAASKKKRSKKR